MHLFPLLSVENLCLNYLRLCSNEFFVKNISDFAINVKWDRNIAVYCEIRKKRLGCTENVARNEMRGAYRVLVGKYEGKSPQGRSRHR